MVVDTLFMCVCEDRNINGADGRWKNSKLAELGGGGDKRDAPVQDGTELQNLQAPDKF